MPVATRFNPFPGLRPFETGEEYLFFGREAQTEQILHRLRVTRFLAVIGASGSGKSSLIRAGLLPYLYGGFMAGAGSHWRPAVFRPGNDPIGNLARALNEPAVLGISAEPGEDAARNAVLVEAALRGSGFGLVEAVRLARLPERDNVLVVVDQFEELFRFADATPAPRHEDAAAFVKLLLEATRQSAVPIYVVLTMRSDFIGDCAKFRDLPDAVTQGLYLIPRMTREQLRSAIAGPVGVGHAEIAPRLVTRLLNDVGENVDELPTLQHALMRTWDYWEAHDSSVQPIDLKHYEAIGGMSEALSLHAEEAYAELSDDRAREVARRLFLGLTERGSDNRELRRPTTVAELATAAGVDVPEVIAVIEAFRRPGRSFLMPPADVPLDGGSVIDISHESLIRGWKRLKQWVDDESESVKVYRRLAETAALHAQGKAGLWDDPDLQNALAWRERDHPTAAWGRRYHPQFDQAMAFLDQSRQGRDAREAEGERQRARELRRTRMFLGAVSFALVVAVLLAVAAVFLARKAERNASLARENEDTALDYAENSISNLQSSLSDRTKSQPDVQDLYEKLLQGSRKVSEDILKRDPNNRRALVLRTLNMTAVPDLHRSQGGAGRSNAARDAADIEREAEKLANAGDYFQRMLAANLFSSSALTLTQLGKKDSALRDAGRASQVAGTAASTARPTDELNWRLLSVAYSTAGGVQKTYGRLKEALDDFQHAVAARQRAQSPTPRSRTQLLTDMGKVAALQDELKQRDSARKTYAEAIRLAQAWAVGASSDPVMVHLVVWQYIARGDAEVDWETYREAEDDYSSARAWAGRLPPSFSDGRYDRAVPEERFANLWRARANSERGKAPRLAEEDLQRALDSHSRALNEFSQMARKEVSASSQRSLAIGESNVGRDYLDLATLKTKRRAEYLAGARSHYSAAAAARQRAVELDPADDENVRALARAYNSLSTVENEAGNMSAWRARIDDRIRALWPLARRPMATPEDRQLLAKAFGTRSWCDLFNGDFAAAIADAERGLAYDQNEIWIHTNEAHGYLFSGQLERARQIYLQYAGKRAYPDDPKSPIFRDSVLDDFAQFKKKRPPKMDLAAIGAAERWLKPAPSSAGQGTWQAPQTP